MSDLFFNPTNGFGTIADPNYTSYIRDKRPQGLEWETIRAIYKNNEICQNAINFKSQTPIKNGRAWKVASKKPEDAKRLEDLEKKLDFQKVIREALFHMYLYGGALVLMHTDAFIEEGKESDFWASELKEDERVEELSVLPLFRLNTGVDLEKDPLCEDYMKPKYFNVRGAGKINASRCLIFKRSLSFDYYSGKISTRDFFGYSIFEAVFTLIKIYEANNNTLLDLAQDSQRIVVQSPDLLQLIMKAGGKEEIQKHYKDLNIKASNISITVLGNGDKMEVIEKDYRQIIESQKDITLRIMGAFGVPEVLGLGKSMTGLGDDPTGYLNIYHEPIVEFQKSDLSDFIRPLDKIMIRQCGFTEDQVTYDWNPLANPSEKDQEEIKGIKLDNLVKLAEVATLTHKEILNEVSSLDLSENKIKGTDLEAQINLDSAIENLRSIQREESKEEEILIPPIPESRPKLLERLRRLFKR